MDSNKKRIAILGGGPSGLFIFKRLIDSGQSNIEIEVFEKKACLGVGMPYGTEGANFEHITNISGNEIPTIVTPMQEWIKNAPKNLLNQFNIDAAKFSDYKVLPRLLFGHYLSDQFNLLRGKADQLKIATKFHFNSHAIDIKKCSKGSGFYVTTSKDANLYFDIVIICTGHHWPKKYEGKFKGVYDSPYPPNKLELQLNHTVAIRGTSLSAIDAIRTLARANGSFKRSNNGVLQYESNKNSLDFKILLHSRNGLLPAVRFHLDNSQLSNQSVLNQADIEQHKAFNNGFVSLDYLFDKDFKELIKVKDIDYYHKIKDLSIEEFVNDIMNVREAIDPFLLLRVELIQSIRSIKTKKSVYWKEMLAVLSFAMNQPAKYFSAEDIIRLQTILMPLIGVVIAFVPQKSCMELLALYNAGVLTIKAVGSTNEVVPISTGGVWYKYTDRAGIVHADFFQTFIDCVGQKHFSFEEFPFKSLVSDQQISHANIRFQKNASAQIALSNPDLKVRADTRGNYLLTVAGIAINDNFQTITSSGDCNPNLYIMAVPYIGGFNPDYSGLDFCEMASSKICTSILNI